MNIKNGFAVSSPVDGEIIKLSLVPDEAFAGGYLGAGAAVEPCSDIIKAPFGGKVKTFHKALHALVLEKDGVEVLIHIGVETVCLNGEGFKAFCAEGDEVEKGAPLLKFDKDFILKHAPSCAVIVIVVSPENAELDLAPEGKVKAGDILFSLKNAPCFGAEEPAANGGETIKKAVVVKNPDGLHARPASALARAASAFKDTSVFISCLGKTANAKSMVEILGLNAVYGAEVEISAQGPQAAAALETVVSALGESTESAAQSEKIDFSKETTFTAQGLYPDMVLGKARHFKRAERTFAETAENPAAEKAKFLKALEAVRGKIEAEISAAQSKSRKDILQAHLSITKDPFLLDYCQKLIENGKTAQYSWHSATLETIKVLEKSGSALLKERKADYLDIENRIFAELSGESLSAPVFPPDTVVITEELLPSEFAFLTQNVKGLIMAGGSPTAHISIMLKNSALPSVIRAGSSVLEIPSESDIVLNSAKGLIIVNPSNLKEFVEQKRAADQRKEKALRLAFEPALTKDGVAIEVKGNIGRMEEAEKAAACGAEGLGLVRSEFLFSGATIMPSEQEQYEVYQKIADSQNGKDIIIRTFDVGGDKPLPFFPLPKEENPIAGLRGVRNYSLNPELFRTQVRAVLRVKPQGSAKIMLPMITFLEELREYKSIIKEEQEKLGVQEIKIGIMVEVPSVALMAESFAAEADFMSLGTNDLTQYTLALDRGHKDLSAKADALNPAVLKLISLTCRACEAANIPLGICGAAASDIQAVPLLLGLGLRSLSVSGALLAEVKDLIRTLSLKDCRDLALAALSETSADGVRALLKEKFSF